MGTTQKTTQQNTYDPTSMGTMQAMLGPGTGGGGGFMGGGPGGSQTSFMGGGKFGGGAPSFMQFPGGGGQQGGGGGLGNVTANYINNPFGNPFFQTQQQMGTRQAQNLGGTQMSDLLRNMTSSGMAGGASSPAGLELQQNQARANTGLQSQLGFLNPVQNALGMQQGAMGLAAGYRPLQTGGTQTQSTGGLGTWLPQVAGMALGGLTGGLGGGLSSLFSHPGGFNYGGANSGPTSFMPQGQGSAFPGGGGDPFGGMMPGGGMSGGGLSGMPMMGGYGGPAGMMPPPMFGVG